MKDEYDFSKGERGKFYREGAAFEFPIYLEHELQVRLGRVAETRGTDVADLVNEYLKSHIAAIESEHE